MPPSAPGSEHPTVALLARAQRGEEAARDALFRAAVPALLTYVRVRLGAALRSRVEPEDVVHEAVMAALPQLATFTAAGPGAFVAWLCRIAEHCITALADHHGARKRTPPGPQQAFSDVATRLVAGGREPASSAAWRDERARVEAALQRLPDDLRDVLLRHYFQDQSLRDIAAATGRSVTTTHRLLGRAAATLGAALAPHRHQP